MRGSPYFLQVGNGGEHNDTHLDGRFMDRYEFVDGGESRKEGSR